MSERAGKGGSPAPPAGEARALTVVCVMLSRGLGGLEQSLLDYSEALHAEGHRVIAVVHPDWPERARLAGLGFPCPTLRSLSEWDPLAVWRLRRLLRELKPSLVLTIGRRATSLARRAALRLPALAHVAQTPNYSLRHLVGLDHVIATTNDLRQALIRAGQPAVRISVIPNMIRLPKDAVPLPACSQGAPVIGALGRFVAKKGFADLIDALALLRERGLRFTARLGGSGPQLAALRARCAAHGLADSVQFQGWISDKRAFFETLDIFCVPSRHEPFGIVVLEGMAHGRPLVVTDAEGPREIVCDGADGLVVPRGDPGRLADALARLIEDEGLRRRLADAGLETVRARYDQRVVAAEISEVLRCVVARRRAVL